MDYSKKDALNLQDAVRDLNARLIALEPKTTMAPSVTERVDAMLKTAASHLPTAVDPKAADTQPEWFTKLKKKA